MRWLLAAGCEKGEGGRHGAGDASRRLGYVARTSGVVNYVVNMLSSACAGQSSIGVSRGEGP